MSQDPNIIVAKLSDNQEYSLETFIRFFIEYNFSINYFSIDQSLTDVNLQTHPLFVDNSLNPKYQNNVSGLLSEYIETTDGLFDFDVETYAFFYDVNHYPPFISTVPENGGNIKPSSVIEISHPHCTQNYEFRIGIVDSINFGKLIIINYIYLASQEIVTILGYKAIDSLEAILTSLLFKFYSPLKIMEMPLGYYREDFMSFFSQENKNLFHYNLLSRKKMDMFFDLNYFNANWEYIDYKKNEIISDELNVLDAFLILTYDKYSVNFQCPSVLIEDSYKIIEEYYLSNKSQNQTMIGSIEILNLIKEV